MNDSHALIERSFLLPEYTTAYSIYREAFTHYLDREDLVALDERGEAFGYRLLEHLFQKGQFEEEVNPAPQTVEKVQHLYIESRNSGRLKGGKALGLGFPLLLHQAGEELVAAPLFIWDVSLEPSLTKNNAWVVKHQPNHRIRINPYLFNFLKKELGVDLKQIVEKRLTKRPFLGTNLIATCKLIAQKLDLESDFQHLNLVQGPQLDELNEREFQTEIHWSGIIGLFPPTFEPSTINWGEKEVIDTLFTHPFGLLPLDQYQATALDYMVSAPRTLISGQSGVGKTHLLIHYITSALSQGKKCLVIAPSAGSLQNIQNFLDKLGLDWLSLLVKDAHYDTGFILDLLKAAAARENIPQAYEEVRFQATLERTNRLFKNLKSNFLTLKQKVFKDNDWTKTIGLFLQSNRKEGKELLSSQLNAQDFAFTDEEYEVISTAIDESYPFYQAINTLRHPLSNLNSRIFLAKEKEEGFRFVEESSGAFFEKASKLQLRFINKTNQYRDQLTQLYQLFFQRIHQKSKAIQDLIADYGNEFGTDFDVTKAGTLRLIGVFSSKHKQILAAREEIGGLYQNLVRSYERGQFFDFQVLNEVDWRSIPKVRENLIQLDQALQNWYENLPKLIQEEINRLSDKNVRSQIPMKEHISDLEYELNLLIEEINDTGLYQEQLENKMLTIPKRQKYLEEIIEQLENTRIFLRDFDAFYNWQRCWLGLTDLGRRVIRALIKVRPNDWMVAYTSWFLDNCLSKYYHTTIPNESLQLDAFSKAHIDLKAQLKSQTVQHWQLQRAAAIKDFRRQNKVLYNQVFGRRTQEPTGDQLENLWKDAAEVITNIFPVLLMTTSAAEKLLQESTHEFDVVLFEDAHALPAYQTIKPWKLGKQCLAFGSREQMQTQTVPSLMNALFDSNCPEFVLKAIHLWNPGNLFQLMEKTDNHSDNHPQFSIRYDQVDGRYQEKEETNEEEARHILHLLNKIKETPQRTFPSVGIVGFTLAQRNLIASYLLDIKRRKLPGAEVIAQLQRNGLGVYHWPELVGQQFDILIISSTFGTIDLKGTLTKKTAILNKADGVAKLQALFSRATKQVFIANSIPVDSIAKNLNDFEQEGMFLLANYFAYAKAFQEGDIERQKGVLLRLLKWKPKAEIVRKNPFVDEVVRMLEPYLETGRIKPLYSNESSEIPLLIKAIRNEQVNVVIQPDGFLAQTSMTSLEWENQKRNQFLANHNQFLPIWSYNWWKNAHQECRKLASAVIKLDEQFGGKEEELEA